jgi:hypothetical protein
MKGILLILVVAITINAQQLIISNFNLPAKPILIGNNLLKSGELDPRISNPLFITLASTVICGAVGFGIGYLQGASDRRYQSLHGLVGMAIGIPIGFAGGLTFGIIKGQRDYKQMQKDYKEMELENNKGK